LTLICCLVTITLQLNILPRPFVLKGLISNAEETERRFYCSVSFGTEQLKYRGG